jgi:hypothetical protein
VVWLVEAAVVSLLRWAEHRWHGRLNGHLRSEAAELPEPRALAALTRTLRLIGSREETIILGAAVEPSGARDPPSRRVHRHAGG